VIAGGFELADGTLPITGRHQTANQKGLCALVQGIRLNHGCREAGGRARSLLTTSQMLHDPPPGLGVDFRGDLAALGRQPRFEPRGAIEAQTFKELAGHGGVDGCRLAIKGAVDVGLRAVGELEDHRVASNAGTGSEKPP
jgi:hypothetical protein